MIGSIIIFILAVLANIVLNHESYITLMNFSKRNWRCRQEYRKRVITDMGSINKVFWLTTLAVFFVVAIINVMFRTNINRFAFYTCGIISILWTLKLLLALWKNGTMQADRAVGQVRPRVFTDDSK